MASLLAIVAGVVVVSGAFFYVVPVRLWRAVRRNRARATLRDLVGLRLRGVPPEKVIPPLITAGQAGVYVQLAQLETHYLAGGDPEKVVSALVDAAVTGAKLSFAQAAATDLAETAAARGGK